MDRAFADRNPEKPRWGGAWGLVAIRNRSIEFR
jgi:hypothetical protein